MKDAIRKGKVVSVTYTLHDEQGNLFEQSDQPASYLHGGSSGLFDKLERFLEGKRVGDSIETILRPEEGFGHHDPALTITDEMENIPPELRYPGASLEAQNAKGELLNFVVKRIENGKLTVDANHPLAGQKVKIRVTIRGLRDATDEELCLGLEPRAAVLH